MLTEPTAVIPNNALLASSLVLYERTYGILIGSVPSMRRGGAKMREPRPVLAYGDWECAENVSAFVLDNCPSLPYAQTEPFNFPAGPGRK